MPSRGVTGHLIGERACKGIRMNESLEKPDKTRIGSGKPGPGRPKGVLNKTTQTAKDAIALAAENLGGSARLVQWAKEDPLNERAFWSSIYPKLLPLQVTGENGDSIKVDNKWVVELVRATPSDS